MRRLSRYFLFCLTTPMLFASNAHSDIIPECGSRYTKDELKKTILAKIEEEGSYVDAGNISLTEIIELQSSTSVYRDCKVAVSYSIKGKHAGGDVICRMKDTGGGNVSLAVAVPPSVRPTIGAESILSMHQAYGSNQARFIKDYRGRSFAGTIPFRYAIEVPGLRGNYKVGFGELNGFQNADISCDVADDKTVSKITQFSSGDNIIVRGLVDDYNPVGSIALKDCIINKK